MKTWLSSALIAVLATACAHAPEQEGSEAAAAVTASTAAGQAAVDTTASLVDPAANLSEEDKELIANATESPILANAGEEVCYYEAPLGSRIPRQVCQTVGARTVRTAQDELNQIHKEDEIDFARALDTFAEEDRIERSFGSNQQGGGE